MGTLWPTQEAVFSCGSAASEWGGPKDRFIRSDVWDGRRLLVFANGIGAHHRSLVWSKEKERDRRIRRYAFRFPFFKARLLHRSRSTDKIDIRYLYCNSLTHFVFSFYFIVVRQSESERKKPAFQIQSRSYPSRDGSPACAFSKALPLFLSSAAASISQDTTKD